MFSSFSLSLPLPLPSIYVWTLANLSYMCVCFLEPQVNNVVVFGDKGELKVEARAVTDSLPLKGFVPRQGQGLPLLGKSSNEPPKGPNTRVDFQFTRAGFDFGPLKFPYPVPFRLLNDEAKGWLDITYLSSTVRIARGNKGTLFILKKEPGDGGKSLVVLLSGLFSSPPPNFSFLFFSLSLFLRRQGA